METVLARVWEMLIGREHGPLAFRLLMQPIVSGCIAVRAGILDARRAQPPWGWALVTGAARRGDLARQGWKDIGRVFVAAVLIDVIYELIVFRWIYPGQALIVAAVLALLPYFLIRGVANRLASRRVDSGQTRGGRDR